MDDLRPLVFGAPGDRAQDDQLLDALWVAEGEGLRDQPAERKARNMALVDAQLLPDVAHVMREVVERAGAFDRSRASMAAQVETDDPEARREARHHLVP